MRQRFKCPVRPIGPLLGGKETSTPASSLELTVKPAELVAGWPIGGGAAGRPLQADRRRSGTLTLFHQTHADLPEKPDVPAAAKVSQPITKPSPLFQPPWMMGPPPGGVLRSYPKRNRLHVCSSTYRSAAWTIPLTRLSSRGNSRAMPRTIPRCTMRLNVDE